MNQRKLILLLFCSTLIIGCGGSKRELDTLNNEISELKTTVGDLNWKLEELDNKFMLLQEQRLTERELEEEDDFEGQELEVPKKAKKNAPPKNLKVVTLKKKSKKAPKKIFLKKEPTSPKGLYREGQDLFLAGQYRKARSKFSKLAENFPFHELADNALYWGAESYYSEEAYEKAIEIFIKIVNEYGEENKAPDAMLKIGYSYIELQSTKKARASFESLIEKHPDTNAALKAKKRLKSL